MSKEVTREEMLEWLWDKQLDADDLQDGATFDMVVAIRRLIEQCDKTSVNVDKHLGLVKCPKVSREWIQKHSPKRFFDEEKYWDGIARMLTELGHEVEE